jgi:hypothetical protein
MITSDPGVVWDTTSLYTTGYVTLLAVPEPSGVLVVAVVAGCILRRRRSKHT